MYRIDWLTPPASAGMPTTLRQTQSGSKQFATEQQAQAEKDFLKATRPGIVVTGPYKVPFLGARV
jgi:hypothetical protein